MKTKFNHADRNAPIGRIKDRAGQIYGRMRDGSIRRLSPLKPFKGKSERRAVVKARREDRQAAAANGLVVA